MSTGWARPTDPPPPPAPAGTVYELAGWWLRAAAAAIDLLIRLAIIAAPAGLGAILFVAGSDAGLVGLIAGGAVGAIASSLLYEPLMLARTNGQTVGHRAVGTRIVMADGSPLTRRQAVVREVLVKNLLIEGLGAFTLYLVTLANYLYPLWDPGRQTLHDKICKTRVVLD